MELHRAKLIKLYGENYDSHPEYQKIVDEVADGRYPHLALYDRLGL